MNGPLMQRVAGNVASAQMLARAGVDAWSIVTYPFRRRRGEVRLQFRDGSSLRAPGGEPVLNLIREIWVQNRYPLPPLADGAFVVDIGAHVGAFALWASRRCPQARIVAIEPSPIAAEYLRRNIRDNHLQNVYIVEAACASDEKDRLLYPRGVLAMNTLYGVNPHSAARQGGVKVPSVTLDAVFERFEIRRCAFLKLDCEGAEYEILFSASREVLGRISIIAMEYHRDLAPFDETAVATFLRDHGFEVTVGTPEDEEGGYLYASASRSAHQFGSSAR